jgi:aspartyl/asparaginyl-tRNA synthetase
LPPLTSGDRRAPHPARARPTLAQAIHRFFDEKGFFWINTPIITASDTEGAGVHMDYGEAIRMLERANERFEFPVKWSIDLPSERERYLTEKYAKKPVIVMNYPKTIKAFYMRVNDDGRTVAALDVLAPGIGEIIGGSQREGRLAVLDRSMAERANVRDAIRSRGCPKTRSIDANYHSARVSTDHRGGDLGQSKQHLCPNQGCSLTREAAGPLAASR